MILLPPLLLLLAAALVVARRHGPPVAAADGPRARWWSWWPLGLFVVVAGLTGAVLKTAYGATGHAAGHLDSAGTAVPVVAMYGVVAWAIGGRARRAPEVWLLGAALAVGAALVVAGNLQVVDAIGGERWSDADASTLGPGRPGFEAGHELSGQGMLVVVGAAALLAVALLARRLAGGPAGIGAVVLSVVFPPWIVPGAGMLVLAVALARGRNRARTAVADGAGLTLPRGRSVRDAGIRERGGPAGVRPESAHRG